MSICLLRRAQGYKMKKAVIGILAHVDAGKTTLSEAMLYAGGAIRTKGRVDKGDAFLDTDSMEKERGITIFSKQAVFTYEDTELILLDTPGHVDFSAEMERTLQVLDYAVLVINGADGVQSHTETLWRLLARYGVPVFLFVNKMDMEGTDSAALLAALQAKLHECCVSFEQEEGEAFWESIAVCEEAVLESFLETGVVEKEEICRLVQERKLFPCFFGSALRGDGVEQFLHGLAAYTKEAVYSPQFGARVFKIARDEKGSRLTYLKITGGVLRVKDAVTGKTVAEGCGQEQTEWEEKVNQIRIYSGDRYETTGEAPAGSVCAVTGLTQTYPGAGLGGERQAELAILEPVLEYRVILPPQEAAAAVLPKLRVLEEEEPKLHIVWEEALQEIRVRVMGEVQLEILQRLVKDRFGILVEFGQGSVVYKETIAEAVTGVGHFEPLRHYAEVQLKLEPGETGSGMQFATACSEDLLARNWQRLILSHLEEKEHRGVLLGAPVTDMKITLLAGRAHKKHTEGGDFRQATYRAVRQGLMETVSVLLEPYYAFTLKVPEKLVGRAMTDIGRMSGKMEPPQMESGYAVLKGLAPVAKIGGYQKEVAAYTGGEGRLSCALQGYLPCHNTEEVLGQHAYDPESDVENPSGSVFCAHGAGFVVPWHEVKAHMHTELQEGSTPYYQEDLGEGTSLAGNTDVSAFGDGAYPAGAAGIRRNKNRECEEAVLGTEEIDSILERTYHANRRDKETAGKGIYRRRREKEAPAAITKSFRPVPKKEAYLLVDGYNIVFAWDELRALAEVNIDGARGRLLDILCDYQAMKGCRLIAVFDAYRVKGHATEILDYHNIHVVYTKEAETADRYIEKFAHENSARYQVTVATSDGLEQIIIRGEGCRLMSAREFWDEILREKKLFQETHMKPPAGRVYLGDFMEEDG